MLPLQTAAQDNKQSQEGWSFDSQGKHYHTERQRSPRTNCTALMGFATPAVAAHGMKNIHFAVHTSSTNKVLCLGVGCFLFVFFFCKQDAANVKT